MGKLKDGGASGGDSIIWIVKWWRWRHWKTECKSRCLSPCILLSSSVFSPSVFALSRFSSFSHTLSCLYHIWKIPHSCSHPLLLAYLLLLSSICLSVLRNTVLFPTDSPTGFFSATTVYPDLHVHTVEFICSQGFRLHSFQLWAVIFFGCSYVFVFVGMCIFSNKEYKIKVWLWTKRQLQTKFSFCKPNWSNV